MKKSTLFIILLQSLLMGFMQSHVNQKTDIPQWFMEHIEYMTTESGMWVTDNSKYKTTEEPYEAYGMKWEAEIEGRSMKGRLYAFRDGIKTSDIWEFRTFWDKEQRQVISNQFASDGTFGTGVFTEERLSQSFSSPDGTTFKTGHISEMKKGEYITTSYTIGADGVWTKRRSYSWKRVSE